MYLLTRSSHNLGKRFRPRAKIVYQILLTLRLSGRGLHGANFQPQIQSTPFSWIQIHSTPNSKINGASIPIHMKVRSVFTCIVLKYRQCLCLMLQIWHIFLNHCCILGI